MALEINQGIARRIEEVINLRSESYTSVARKIGVTSTTVWNLAGGRTTASIERILQLAEALEVSPCYLAFGVVDDQTAAVLSQSAVGTVTVPEYSHQAGGGVTLRRKWTISERFVSKILNASASDIFIFENISNTIASISPGDLVVVDKTLSDPHIDGEGFYLISRAHVPLIMYIALSFEGESVFKLSTSYDGDDYTLAGREVEILGKVIGEIKKSNLPIPSKRR